MNETLDLEFKKMVCIALRDNYDLWQVFLNRNVKNDFHDAMNTRMNMLENLADMLEDECVKAEERRITLSQMIDIEEDDNE